jgi:ABC-2 type transport system permease protein
VPALLYLFFRQTIGTVRQLRRRLRGVKGAIVGFLSIAAMLFLLGPQLILFVYYGLPDPSFEAIERVRTVGPPFLLLLTVLSVSAGRGLYFRPAEIELLFPAPIDRRAILFYHVLTILRTVFLSTIWLGLFTAVFMPHWYSGLSGIFCALAFIQLSLEAIALFMATVAVHFAKWVRRGIFIAAALIACWAAFDAGRSSPRSTIPRGAIFSLTEHPAIVALSAPMRPFIELFLAPDLPSAALWGAISFAILASVFFAIAVLDVAFEESAVQHSRKVQDKLRRASGGLALTHDAKKTRALPQLPRLGGAGPLLWRQLTEMIRNSQVLWSLVIVFVVWLMFTGSMGDESPFRGRDLYAGSAPILAALVAMTSQGIAFDFRRDLDRMAFLKSLPLSPFAIALGQLLSNVLVALFVQVVALGALILLAGAPLRIYLVLGLLLPFDAVLAVIDNGIFLLAPHRINPKQPGDLAFAARTMLLLFVKSAILLLAVTAGGLIAVPLYFAFDGSILAAACGMAVALLIQAALGTLLVAVAFERFDLSRDVPA